ncbi:ornithine cyclodeaminase family protein [Haloferax sp. MBLA0076]|uniref:Ornithine cyclodeaminase family protein n=1 Tax=Haloferax litoreum TaxID=2666140 RepID=A0A6A8GED1_9EURY|nr:MULTISPECIES: ornithine cyclodeaminase family protein [Haloferax]KAB1192958.1 ornithine cyclodeaminase family protein [Haloferax sp. CBA1148]MRX21445.1 ornithine cyclodeaminase family protein [Haloferax litoreum]
MVQILSADAVRELLSLSELFPVVEEAFVKQGRGEVERPPRPHFPVGIRVDSIRDGIGPQGESNEDPATDSPLGTALTMPAYIHGRSVYATKLAAVHPNNAAQCLPTVNAQVVLTDSTTGLPLGFFDGNSITSARTGCIGGLAAEYLATDPIRLGVIGAGTQARWQTRAIAAGSDVESVRIYSPSDSRDVCAADLRGEGLPADAVDSPEEAVSDANVVVTATTSTDPVFDGKSLEPGTLVVAVGAYTAEMQELDETTFDRAARVFADVPEEVADIGDVREAGLSESDLVPLSEVFEGVVGRDSDEEILVVESVGSAVLDAATAEYLYEKARERGVGEDVGL